VGLFVTPVVYRNTFVPEQWRWLVALNPMTGFIEVFRGAVLGLPKPAPRILLTSLAASAVTIAVGVWYFTRSEAAIVDVV
jgi:ABC-type polysaccharide/polyol phosphate export permease